MCANSTIIEYARVFLPCAVHLCSHFCAVKRAFANGRQAAALQVINKRAEFPLRETELGAGRKMSGFPVHHVCIVVGSLNSGEARARFSIGLGYTYICTKYAMLYATATWHMSGAHVFFINCACIHRTTHSHTYTRNPYTIIAYTKTRHDVFNS